MFDLVVSGNYAFVRRIVISVASGLAVCWAAAGCGTGQRGEEAEAAADAFVTALAEGDGAAACGLMSPDAAEQLAAEEGKPCEAAVLAQDLPTDSAGRAEVWGDRAQVRTGGDVHLFGHVLGQRQVAHDQRRSPAE